ncbi:unnamed protein product [Spirodela intermedia]|uniref:RRM domain-containing protein n=1 Tax=Spirodela intermedia TaxID=51605 RepID=A0ABN7EE73_SPIIN|nr:unnamed protein product [Spirodela intermedia]
MPRYLEHRRTCREAPLPPCQKVYVASISLCQDTPSEEHCSCKRSLYGLFLQYGRILDVVALKIEKLRGQAWVVFSELTAASTAVRQMQNFPFYDKLMRIQYTKMKSDCIAREEGTNNPQEKRKKQEEKAEKKRNAKEVQQSGAADGGPHAEINGASQAFQGKPEPEDAVTTLNNILFIQNLPHETTSMMLQILFQQYPSFREVRMINAKPSITFVEFEDDVQSSIAMQSLQGFKITPTIPWPSPTPRSKPQPPQRIEGPALSLSLSLAKWNRENFLQLKNKKKP